MNDTYFDCWGKEHTRTANTAIRNRKGVWFILYYKDSILFIHPNYAPNIIDLPGGGIDSGETIIEAACRELYEETELKIPSASVDEQHKQRVPFFADYDSEFWDYDQTQLLVTKDLDALYFEEKRKVTEGYCEWIQISDLHKYKIHYMHKKALEAFGLINNI